METSGISALTQQMGSDIDTIADDSGCATRAILGWLGDARGPDADMNIELLTLRHQQQLVEDDSHVGGSDYLSESASIVNVAKLEVTTSNRTIQIHSPGFVDADLVDRLDVEKDYLIENYGGHNSGWCGLDAVNHGLFRAGLMAVGKEEALTILARTEAEIEESGMSVRDLENLLNARNRSVGIVDMVSGMSWKFKVGRQDVILIAADFRHHFMGITKRQDM